MITPLNTPQHPQRDKKKDMDQLQAEYDRATGRAPAQNSPYKEPAHLTQALDALENRSSLKERGYVESPEMKKKQEAFDDLVRNGPAVPVFKHGPVSKKERLEAWHKAIGSPQSVIDRELAALKEAE